MVELFMLKANAVKLSVLYARLGKTLGSRAV
jgi:hypothetical protein